VTLLDLLEETETNRSRFLKFHEENPQVYEALHRLALDLVDAGHSKFGISMIYEVLRWQHAMRTTDPRFKLNNDFRAGYARLLMANDPRLSGVFETRRVHE
jgi:hypothetical protein